LKFKSFIAFSILVPFLTSTAIILAQTSLDDDSKNDIEPTSPLVTAMKVETPPVLDGEVLNDAAWQAAKAVTGFWQTTPDQGQAASEKNRGTYYLHQPHPLFRCGLL